MPSPEVAIPPSGSPLAPQPGQQPPGPLHLSRRRIGWLCLLLLVQGLALHSARLEEKIPLLPDFDPLPSRIGPWELQGEEPLDAATQALLRPDAALTRAYQNTENSVAASLYIGYFKTTQANHPAPHTPTVCLPGAGWRNVYLKTRETFSVRGQPMVINEYVLEKGSRRIAVYFWFQNAKRSWASEVMSKIYMFPDYWALRRTDVAIVRVIVPVSGENLQPALRQGLEFAQQVYPEITKIYARTLPSPLPPSQASVAP